MTATTGCSERVVWGKISAALIARGGESAWDLIDAYEAGSIDCEGLWYLEQRLNSGQLSTADDVDEAYFALDSGRYFCIDGER